MCHWKPSLRNKRRQSDAATKRCIECMSRKLLKDAASYAQVNGHPGGTSVALTPLQKVYLLGAWWRFSKKLLKSQSNPIAVKEHPESNIHQVYSAGVAMTCFFRRILMLMDPCARKPLFSIPFWIVRFNEGPFGGHGGHHSVPTMVEVSSE